MYEVRQVDDNRTTKEVQGVLCLGLSLSGRPASDNPDDILYDEWPTDGDEGEDAMMVYEYYKSATGVYLAYNETVQALSFELAPWASNADVSLYVKLVNAVLKKHPRAKLYAQYDILKGLTEEDGRR